MGPCIPGCGLAGLYELWKAGLYRNYDPAELVDLTAHILALVPPWTRVYRVQRDIPMPLVTRCGARRGNGRRGGHCPFG